MSKEDAPAPDVIPKKRRQIEAVPALWIATWLARDDITPSERRRLEEEKQRRKNQEPDQRVGVIPAQEGMTPEQLATFRRILPTTRATEVHHPGVASKVHGTCRSLGVPVIEHRDMAAWSSRATEIVKGSDMIVAAPKDTRSSNGDKRDVWAIIRHARDRKLPVTIIMPNGDQEDHGVG